MLTQEEKCSHAVSGVAQASRLQEEADLLQNALRDIAHAVIQDSEGRDTDPQPTPHVHLTPSQAVPPRYACIIISDLQFLNFLIRA